MKVSKINSIEIIINTLKFIIENLSTFIRALAIPLAILCIISLMSSLNFKLDLLGSIIFYLFLFISVTIIGVTTNRLIILGKESVPEWGLSLWGKREFSYLYYLIIAPVLALLPCLAVCIPFFLFPDNQLLFFVVYYFVYTFVISRFALVFSMVSVDRKTSIVESWKQSKNYKWSTMFIVAIYPVILILIQNILSNFIPDSPLTHVLFSIISGLGIFLMIATVASLYVKITIKN